MDFGKNSMVKIIPYKILPLKIKIQGANQSLPQKRIRNKNINSDSSNVHVLSVFSYRKSNPGTYKSGNSIGKGSSHKGSSSKTSKASKLLKKSIKSMVLTKEVKNLYM